jgi:hypothetical protein
MESISAEDLNNGDIKVQLQFGNNNGSTVRTVSVDYVQIKVHYIARGQTVYFHEDGADVASGQVYSFELHDGDWQEAAAIPEVLSTGTVTLNFPSVGNMYGIEVDGVEIMSGTVGYTTDINTLATDIAANITAHTSSPNYTATSAANVITISAAAGTGEDPNGFSVITDDDLDNLPGSYPPTTQNMSGGSDYVPAVGGTATGYMSFQNIDNPGLIKAGQTIYTRENSGGVVVAVTAGDISRNLLPSEAELAAQKSKWRVIEANFYQNDEGAAIYGTTGADSAFLFDLNDHFAYIRPPIARSKDKPRHVAFLSNHLVLGLDSGHILVSAIDVPNDFDTSGTATTWSFRDPITGLNPIAGNALAVMCRESVHAFIGTQAPSELANDPFRTQHLTPKSGALEYTVADVMGPMYGDFSGVGTLQTTDKFGDFSPGRLTAAIEDWTRERFQKQPSSALSNKAPVCGIPVRRKNQYRIYFEDGYILSLFVGSPERAPEAMLGHLDPENLSTDYVPTWMDSTVLSTGRERVVMGDKNGNVWIVDGANGIQTASGLTEVPCYITTNPMNTGYPQGATKTYAWTVLGDFMAAQEITTTTGYDYLDVPDDADRTKVIGSYSDAPIFEAEPALTDVYTGVYTDGVSFKIETNMDGSKPHTLHTLLHRFSHKGSGRNNTTINRG